MRLRPAGWRDCLRVRRWRNDPSTRMWMRDTSRVGLLRHLRWYWRTLRSGQRHLYVAEELGVRPISFWGNQRLVWRPVGTGRLDAAGARTVEVDVVVAPGFRGAGRGRRIIGLLCERSPAQASVIVAHVRPDNEASLRAFEAAGFVQLRGERDGHMTLMRRT